MGEVKPVPPLSTPIPKSTNAVTTPTVAPTSGRKGIPAYGSKKEVDFQRPNCMQLVITGICLGASILVFLLVVCIPQKVALDEKMEIKLHNEFRSELAKGNNPLAGPAKNM